MNVGITTIYAHRQIVHYAYYLAKLLKKDDHKVSCLVCDSSLPTCHSRMAKGSSRALECTMCVLGGLRSFPVGSYFSRP